MEDFEKMQETRKLLQELAKGEASAKENGHIDISEVEALPGGEAMAKINFTPDALEDMKEIKAYITDEVHIITADGTLCKDFSEGHARNKTKTYF